MTQTVFTHEFNQQTKVGEVARLLPGATRVFRAHRIDFCCGGGVTLQEACKDNLQVVLDSLQTLQDMSAPLKSPMEKSLAELTHFIVSVYHEKHRRDLPELLIMAQRVETVHAENPQCPQGLAHRLSAMYAEMQIHMQKEEQILFPAIEDGVSGAHLLGPVTVMRQDHEDLGRDMAELERLTHNFTLPDGACNTWAALYLGVQTFINDLMEHVHLENNVLFPRVMGEI